MYSQVYNGPDIAVDLQCSVLGLDTLYAFRVRALSGDCHGEWSREVTIKTSDLPPLFDGSEILAPQAAKNEAELLKMFNNPTSGAPTTGVQLKLLYRGSRDGFNAASFHAKCDAANTTLTVIRSTTGYISGGYAALSWAGNGHRQSSDNWLFSLYPTPLKLLCSSPQYAQYTCSSYGPIFGAGNDVQVNGAMQSNSNHSNPASYQTKDPQYPNINYTHATLFGASNFTVAEIEVFQVIS
jgi:hypothetical protein